jgi:decaprenylphospho-beta-D-erythro-pentofuranosid-2-ulose 2-reductase
MEVTSVGATRNFIVMRVLILGASSDIAIALARKLATDGHHLQLAGRNKDQLHALKSDLETRNGILVEVIDFDAMAYDTHQAIYDSLVEKPDVVVLAFGYLGSSPAVASWMDTQTVLATNFTGAVSILNIIASDFETRKKGTIVGISSVAGDRGRMSNYIYGAAKAGFTAYLSGLRNRLFHAGVHVMTVKPGFVRTKMTEGLPLPKSLTADPEKVARLIVNGIRKKRDVIYVLPIWSFIMLVIRLIPEWLFKKLKL